MIDDELKAELIQQYLANPPKRRRTSYLDLMIVQPLPQGALPIYDKDPSITEHITSGHDPVFLDEDGNPV